MKRWPKHWRRRYRWVGAVVLFALLMFALALAGWHSYKTAYSAWVNLRPRTLYMSLCYERVGLSVSDPNPFKSSPMTATSTREPFFGWRTLAAQYLRAMSGPPLPERWAFAGVRRYDTTKNSWVLFEFSISLRLLYAAMCGLALICFWRGWMKRARNGMCETCGYDLRATRDRCPECGTPPARPVRHAAAR